MGKKGKILIAVLLLTILFPMMLWASTGTGIPSVCSIRFEFILFGMTLLGIAFSHRHTLSFALIGLATIVAFKLIFDHSFPWMEHFFGNHPIGMQIIHKEIRSGEWSVLLNLIGLLLGFAILSRHFEDSGVPEYLPKYLPSGWKGPFVLLAMILVLSSFLDNIAGALIGGTIAFVVFKGKVHIGYIAAIVAASNAGGAGSVVGDTTTTMMWIEGVHPVSVFHAYIGSVSAFVFFAFFASIQQYRYHPIDDHLSHETNIDRTRLIVIVFMLLLTITTSILFDLPALGLWIAILTGGLFRKNPWSEVKAAIPGTIFLMALVISASMMPVEDLPVASWHTVFSLGFTSSIFDNIPLTKLALEQGGYDWGILAYAVGFGGSILWFGSSAGVAISSRFHETRSVISWIKNGWHILVAYLIGFFVLLSFMGWHPQPLHKKKSIAQTEQSIQLSIGKNTLTSEIIKAPDVLSLRIGSFVE
ncbi:MAG: citrate transporter [Bacteroidota bacterium]|nr:citrate transporter [Bacteroidota bacterium]MDP4205537.1 citrate transporter [Bacteroidota bacterium]